MIFVRNNGDSTYIEENTDAVWVRDSYTEPREMLFGCIACGEEITDWDLWTCLDGGDAAHTSCVTITGKHLFPGMDSPRLFRKDGMI